MFDSAKKSLHLLDTVTTSHDANGVPHKNAFEAITVVCKGIRHVQTALEASGHITIIKVIPMLEVMKVSLHLVSSGVIDSVTMMVPSIRARELATATPGAKENIFYHHLWAAFLVVHPCLSGLSFLSQDACDDVEANREAFVQNIR